MAYLLLRSFSILIVGNGPFPRLPRYASSFGATPTLAGGAMLASNLMGLMPDGVPWPQ